MVYCQETHSTIAGVAYPVPPRLNLHTDELTMIYENVVRPHFHPGHIMAYTVCVLAWATAMRTGSFSKAKNILTHGTAQEKAAYKVGGPLRLQHREFFYTNGGIAVRVEFCHLKGKKRQDMSTGATTRKYTFMPLRSNRRHLDLASLLIAIAYKRGYFTQPLEELLMEASDSSCSGMTRVPTQGDKGFQPWSGTTSAQTAVSP